MKVLIPIENDRITPRFISAKTFRVFEINESGVIKGKSDIDVSSMGSFEKARLVRKEKIDIVICLGIENWIYHYLTGFNIKVIVGIAGDAEEVIKNLTDGKLQIYGLPLYGCRILPVRRHGKRWKRGRKFNHGHFGNRFM